VAAPRGYVFEEEACKEVEIPDLKTCVLRKPEAERPGADEVLIAGDVPGVFVLHRPVESGHENTGVLKNLTGYIQDPRQKERVLYLDKNCQGCRLLTRCGAVFGAASEAGTLAIDRDAHKAHAVHLVLECDTSEELSRALLDRLHEGERRGVVRGFLPIAGGGARSGLGPNDIFRAILGQPWKVEEVRLPDARSGGVFEVHVAAVDGQGSAGLQNLAAVALLKRCNLRCIMCQIPVFYPESDVPAPDLFRTFLELRLHGFDWLTTFGGEPLLRADLEGLIEAARMLGFGVDMVTNGSYLDAERAKSLAKSGLNFCMVSVDGATADTHDFVRAKEGSFLEAIDGLKNFRANAPDARLELNSVIVEENKHQLRDLVNLAGDLEVNRANLFLCVSAPVLAPEPHWLDVPSLKKILSTELPALREEATKKGIEITLSPGFPEGRLDEFIQEAAEGTYNLYYQSGTRCQAPDKEIFVSVKQEVYGCASPTVLESGTALGALHQQSLGSIYATAQAQHFSGSAADHDPCKMCWRCDPEIEVQAS
jgi:MoaA/NifB/PqqE/SkfB family radical SAM enzyme